MRKSIKTVVTCLVLFLAFCTAFYYLWLVPRYTVPILMYHHIGDKEGDGLYVRPDSFTRQLAYIKRQGYNVISLDELVEGIKRSKKFRRNTVVITFDDGYEDNYTFAYRILKRCNLPATIFLISDYVGKKKGFLNWQQVREMQKDSRITFGAHTRRNAYLPDIKKVPRLKDEIAGSKRVISEKAKVEVNYFCYPSGGFTPKAKEIIKQSGYKGACTTNRGFVRFNRDVYELKRIKIKDTDFVKKPLDFWAKLSGYYNVFRRGKNPY